MTSVASEVLFDPPGALEILRKVASFLDEEVYAEISDHKIKYRVKVAVNLMSIAIRELSYAPPAIDQSGSAVTAAIADTYGGLDALTQRLATGALSILDADVYDALCAYIEMRLEVAAAPPRNTLSISEKA